MQFFFGYRNEILDKVDSIVSSGFSPDDVGIIVVSAMIYYQVANYESALRILRQGETLEWYDSHNLRLYIQANYKGAPDAV